MESDRKPTAGAGRGTTWLVVILLVTCTVAGFWMVSTGEAHASEDSPEQSALIMLRLLAYDRNIGERAPGEDVRFVVAYPEEGEPGEIHQALEEASSRVELEGRPIRIESIAYSGPEDFQRKMDELRPAGVFVGAGLEDRNEEIAQYAVDHDILTFTRTRQMLETGAAVGVIPDGQVELIVNLPLAEAQGVDFPGSVLRTADRVHR